MSLAFPTPDHMPCPECGASVPVGSDAPHACDEERLLDYRLVESRADIERFDEELAGWLESPSGRFARWLAENDVR